MLQGRGSGGAGGGSIPGSGRGVALAAYACTRSHPRRLAPQGYRPGPPERRRLPPYARRAALRLPPGRCVNLSAYLAADTGCSLQVDPVGPMGGEAPSFGDGGASRRVWDPGCSVRSSRVPAGGCHQPAPTVLSHLPASGRRPPPASLPGAPNGSSSTPSAQGGEPSDTQSDARRSRAIVARGGWVTAAAGDAKRKSCFSASGRGPCGASRLG